MEKQELQKKLQGYVEVRWETHTTAVLVDRTTGVKIPGWIAHEYVGVLPGAGPGDILPGGRVVVWPWTPTPGGGSGLIAYQVDTGIPGEPRR